MALKPFTGTLDEPDSAAAGLKPFDGALDGEESSLTRRLVGDTAVTALKSAIAVPEAAVGLADIVTGGRAGKAVQDLGVDFKRAKDIASEWYSPEQQQANRNLQNAQGFVGTLQAAAENPSAVAHTIGESIAPMFAGGAVARSAGLISKLSPLARGAIGEGVVSAGMQAEQTRQGTDDGLLTPQQSVASAGAGATTGLISRLSGGLAKKMGIEDVDTLLAGGTTTAGKVGMAKRVGQGLLTEGALEEMPQSAQEQVWQNYAEGRQLMEGVPEASALGLVTGGIMGGGINALRTGSEQPQVDPTAGPLSRAAATAQQTGAAQAEQARQAAQQADTAATAPAAGEARQGAANAAQAGLSAEAFRQQPTIPPADSFSGMNEFADLIAQERADLEQRRNPPPFEEMKGVDAGFDPMSRARNQVPPPSGSFASMNEFADLLGQEQADVQQRRDGIAQTQGLQRDSRLESIGNEIDANRQQQTAQARLSLLDQLDADPETVNLLPRFESMLKKQGYAQRRATPEERELIARRMDARAALVNADQEPVAPNELDAAAMGIRERQPKVRQPQQAPAEKPARAAFPMTQTGAQRQAAERTQATGQAFEVVPHPTVKGRFAVQPVAAANTSPERVTATPEIEQVAPTNALLNAGEIGTQGTDNGTPSAQALAPTQERGTAQQAEVTNVAGSERAVPADGVPDQNRADATIPGGAEVHADSRPGGAQAAQEGGAQESGQGVEELRRQLRAVEDEIMRAAPSKFGNGQLGGDIEGAMRSLKVPKALKEQRKVLKEQVRAAQQPRSDLDTIAERVTEPTHADPDQAPEAATAPVIREAIQKSARNTEFNAKEAKAWLLADIDRAIADAPTLADKGARYAKDGRVERANGGAFTDFEKSIGFVTLDVPGDGSFKVLNTKETLQRFRDKAERSPGFREDPTTGMKLDPRPAGPTKKEQSDAITKAVKEGRRSEALDDLGNAIEIARLHGANDDPLLERFREIADKDYDAWRAEQEAEGEIAAREAGQSATPNSPEPRAEQGQQADTGADTATIKESLTVATEDAGKKPAKTTIGDFGEKIGGARKDVWSGFKDKLDAVADDDIAAEPLSKSWPAPDYQAMIDGGADPWAVAFMRAARDAVPTKPQKGYKVRAWAQLVQGLRAATKGLADGTVSQSKARGVLIDMARTSRHVQEISGRIDLYLAVGHSQSLADVSISSGEYSLYEGVEYNPARTIWTVSKKTAATALSNWPRELATGATREEAIRNFKERFDALTIAAPASKEVSFDIYVKHGVEGYWIGKKLGRNHVDLARFDTLKEAREYKRDHNAELVAKLEKVKEIPRTRRDTNEPRVGEDMRDGQDVTPEMFGESFGFRGVEFGNWVEQKKRQKDLNDAYDALMDMSAILGVPPKALSLNGELGLAFGARGKGGVDPASAHYERGKVVINLTKKEGAGSLGHEWWHALDNYFSRMRAKGSDMMTEALDVSLAARGSDFVGNTAVRREMIQAFGEVVKAIKLTAMKARSQKLDSRRSTAYWTTGDEMSARAFESYLISKLHDQNASNDYLANIVDDATWKAAESLGFELDDSYPYPTAGEIPGIRAGFDKFFEVIQTNETDKGIALFSRDAASTGTTPDAIWSAVESLVGPLRRRRIVVVQSADVLVEQGILQSRDANGAQAFVKDGKAYFIASNIQPGNERAVFLHEVGAHLGMEKILSPLQRSVLLNRIKTWAAQANGSVESRIAQAAQRRVEAAGVTGQDAESELLAYMVEEAVKAGINPTTDTAGPIGQWFKTLWAALRTALEKLGLVNASRLTAQDIVNLAHGAANVAMSEDATGGDVQHSKVDGMRRGTRDQAEAMGYARAYRGVSQAMPFNDSGTVWLTTSRDAAQSYAEEVFGYDDPSVMEIWYDPKAVPSFDMRKVSEEQLEALEPDEFGNPQKPGIYRNSDDSMLGGSGAGTVIHMPKSATLVVEDGGAQFSRADQIDSPAFKRWFGGSKVVDEQGRPLALYHGTNADFDTFDPKKIKYDPDFKGNGFHFDDDEYMAGVYGRNVRAFYLSIENPVSRGKANSLADDIWDDWEEKYPEAYSFQEAVRLHLQKLGYDGVHFGKNHYVAFRPEQIKSATGNSGAFSPSDPRIQFSRAAMPDWLNQMPQATQEAARKAGIWQPHKPLKERLKDIRATALKRVQQGLVDQFAPLKELGDREYVLARLTKSSDAPLEALLLYGKPFLNDAGAIDVNLEKGGLIGGLQKLEGEHDRFFAWMAGNRAEQLKAEGRENLFTDTDITALKDLNQGNMPDGSSRAAKYNAAKLQFSAYSKAVLDIAEKAGIIAAEDRAIWEKDFYVPFYRAMEDGDYKGPRNASGLVNQYAFKKLKGGTDNLNDLMQNTLRNWSHLLSASLKNQASAAALESAEAAGVATPISQKQKGSVSFLGRVKHKIPKGQSYVENGVTLVSDGTAEVETIGEKHYMVDDPFILNAITSLEFAGWNNPAMKMMQKAKHYLTLGVTISPTFKIRNLIRDQISAIGLNPMSYNLMSNLAQGWKGTDKDSAQYAKMLAGGGLMRFGTFLEDDRAEHMKRLIQAGVSADTVLDTQAKVKAMLGKAWDWWQDVGDRSENIARASIYQQRYDQFVKEGKTADEAHLLASFAARDSMDFSLQGQWGSIRFLTQLVPFLGARLQGLYKLGREGVAPSVRLLTGNAEMGDKERAMRFGAVTGTVALASIALFLAYRDDDDWKDREEWDRDAYWWFKVGDTAFRIPKPFEIGAIGTIAERGLETALNGMDKESRRIFIARMWEMLMGTFAMNPVPQLFKPVIDLYANTDSFTGRPIETMGMERLSKAQRIGPGTSATAQLLGKATSLVGLSPVQVDHLIEGYFSWLGTHAVMTTDFALRPLMGLPDQPARKWPDGYFVLGDFAKDLPSNQSKYLTQFYEQSKKVQEAMADIRYYQSLGQTEKALELSQDNADKIRMHGLYTHAERQISGINKQIKAVQMSSATADAKREQIDRLTQARNQIAKAIESRRVALQ